MTADRVRASVEEYYRTIAPYYAHEVANRGDEAYWTSLGGAHAGARVLELGAGTGRVTALLAAWAGRVVALDLSPEMLVQCRARLGQQPDVWCVLGDMRGLGVSAAFDLVVAADDPFSHLTEDVAREQAVQEAARALKRGGTLVLDALWLPPGERRHAAHAEGRQRTHDHSLHGRPLRVVENWQCDPRTRQCVARYEYYVEGAPVTQATFRACYWSEAEVRERLARAGLEVHALWGSYDRQPWRRETARQMIVEARKP